MDQRHFSVDHEPALGGGPRRPDPAEHQAAPTDRPPDELESLRDGVHAEPALADQADPDRWNQWLAEKRRGCTLAGNLTATAMAAAVSGPFAILGALMTGRPGLSGILYVVIFGPIIEELLKQSGMTFLLEKKPYRIFAAWQFVFSAIVAGLTFGVIENLVYIHVYAPGHVDDMAALATFRWLVCMPLHAVWASVASIGLIRVWRRQLRTGQAADLSAAFPWFTAAIVLHGAYNAGAMFVSF